MLLLFMEDSRRARLMCARVRRGSRSTSPQTSCEGVWRVCVPPTAAHCATEGRMGIEGLTRFLFGPECDFINSLHTSSIYQVCRAAVLCCCPPHLPPHRT